MATLEWLPSLAWETEINASHEVLLHVKVLFVQRHLWMRLLIPHIATAVCLALKPQLAASPHPSEPLPSAINQRQYHASANLVDREV